MSSLKKAYYRAASMIPLRLLRQPEILLPYHHLVSDVRVRHIEHLFPYKNKRQFISDLDYLLAHFRVVDPGELIVAARDSRAIEPGGFLLTFDDGLREVYDIIAPILLEKGVPALFFLNTAFIDNRDLFYRSKASLIADALLHRPMSPGVMGRMMEILGLPSAGTEALKPAGTEALKQAVLAIKYPDRGLTDRLGECLGLSFEDYLRIERPYLSTPQIEEMVGKGFCFGGHSIDHPNYRYIPLIEQLEQTRDSCRVVREKFGLSYTAFSFPHEDAPVRQGFFEALASPGAGIAAAEGLIAGPDILFGTQNQRGEKRNRMYHRFNAERPEYPIEGLVKGMLLYNRVKRQEIDRAG